MATTKYKIESGVQLLARLTKKPEVKNFYPSLFQCGLKRDDIVEIVGSNIYSNLLIDLISEALLPSEIQKEPIGVLVFKTDGQFNFKELVNVLKRKIVESRNYSSLICQDVTDSILLETLSNFFVLDIYDATQLYTTIHNLDSILTEHQSITLLIFDTLTAFYWSEQGFKITKMDLYIENLLRMVQKVSKEYNVILIYTRPGYFSSSKELDNFETTEVQSVDGVNFRVQLVVDDNNTGAYQINVRTIDATFKKMFTLIDYKIKWQ